MAARRRFTVGSPIGEGLSAIPHRSDSDKNAHNFGYWPESDRGCARGRSWLELDLLGYLESIIDFDAEIPNRALQLRVTEEQLDGSQLTRLAVDLVGYVLEGSIQHQGGRVRITAQLIDMATNSHLWSQRWERPDEDLFAVQSEIAEQVTDELGRDTGLILKAEREAARRKPPGNLSAYESYLLGSEKLARPDPTNLQEAVRLFKRAAELDPHLARAWSELSLAYNVLSYSGRDFDTWHQLARDAAEHAVSLDPDDAEAHAALAAVLVSAGDIIRAKGEAETALRLAPGSAGILTLYAGWAATLGEPKRGGQMADQAIRLDPNYPISSVPSFAYGYFAADRYEDSLRVLERLPTDGYTPDMWVVHPGALATVGRLNEAKEWVKEALKRFPELTAEGWANSPGYADDERLRFLKTMKLAGFPACAKPENLAKITKPVRLPECASAHSAPN